MFQVEWLVKEWNANLSILFNSYSAAAGYLYCWHLGIEYGDLWHCKFVECGNQINLRIYLWANIHSVYR